MHAPEQVVVEWLQNAHNYPVQPSDLIVKQVRGGLTNALYTVNCRQNDATCFPKKLRLILTNGVAVRYIGILAVSKLNDNFLANAAHMDREHEKCMVDLLSRHGLAKKILYQFPVGKEDRNNDVIRQVI